jgi:hypothetical protein
LLKDKELVDGRPAVYLCHNFTCEKPITGAAELAEKLENMEIYAR